MSLPIVTSVDNVTAEWLTRVLESSGAAKGASVVSFDAMPVGTGQMGENSRFALQWSEPNGRPSTVVGKFPSNNPISLATATGGGSYAREVRFYNEIAATVSIRTPRCHFADVDPESGLFVLLMEDLAPGVQGDQLRGCSPAQAEIVVRELVKLQAPRWNDPALHTIDWLPRRNDGSGGVAGLYEAVLPGFMEGIGTRLGVDHQRLLERFARSLGAWRDGTPQSHLVVTHGDYRLDNMMFGEFGEQRDPLAVVDWQTPAHGCPATDLSYFLGAGLLPEVRRTHERALVESYHDALASAGVLEFDLEQCWTQYRREAFAGVVMAVVASQIVVQTERGDEMFLAMASRHATQILDLESESLI